MEFGGLYVNGGSTAIGGIATGGWTEVSNFDTAMGYNQVIPNAGNNDLEALHRELFYFSFEYFIISLDIIPGKCNPINDYIKIMIPDSL